MSKGSSSSSTGKRTEAVSPDESQCPGPTCQLGEAPPPPPPGGNSMSMNMTRTATILTESNGIQPPPVVVQWLQLVAVVTEVIRFAILGMLRWVRQRIKQLRDRRPPMEKQCYKAPGPQPENGTKTPDDTPSEKNSVASPVRFDEDDIKSSFSCKPSAQFEWWPGTCLQVCGGIRKALPGVLKNDNSLDP